MLECGLTVARVLFVRRRDGCSGGSGGILLSGLGVHFAWSFSFFSFSFGCVFSYLFFSFLLFFSFSLFHFRVFSCFFLSLFCCLSCFHSFHFPFLFFHSLLPPFSSYPSPTLIPFLLTSFPPSYLPPLFFTPFILLYLPSPFFPY